MIVSAIDDNGVARPIKSDEDRNLSVIVGNDIRLYSSPVMAFSQDLSLPTGGRVVTIYTVPDDNYVKFTLATAQYSPARAAGFLQFRVTYNSVIYRIATIVPAVASFIYQVSLPVFLPPGAVLDCNVVFSVAGDIVSLSAFGERVL
jgi:hypothetical protein